MGRGRAVHPVAQKAKLKAGNEQAGAAFEHGLDPAFTQRSIKWSTSSLGCRCWRAMARYSCSG